MTITSVPKALIPIGQSEEEQVMPIHAVGCVAEEETQT